MSSGFQARWLAPLALAAVLLAVAFVVTSSTGDGSDDPPAASQGDGRTGTSTGTRTGEDTAGSGGGGETGTTATTPRSQKKTYRVQTGDTFGAIAEETGVSVEELQELNPAVDPQSLTVGQEIKLSR
jgi:teichoic acid transport system ATP-binding protein